MTDPLLEMNGLPAFSRITPDLVEPAVDHLLNLNRQEIQKPWMNSRNTPGKTWWSPWSFLMTD